MKTIVGIPGLWPDERDLVSRLASAGRLALRGKQLVAEDSGEWAEIDVYGRDEELTEAFEVAGGERMDPAVLQLIARHTFTVYLQLEGGSAAAARVAMRLAARVLDAGGLAVKVESAGCAHTAGRWRELLRGASDADVSAAFVVRVLGPGRSYSCGMHNLGLRDAEVVGAGLDEAGRVLHAFNLFQLLEKPTLRDGETFATADEARPFMLAEVACDQFPGDDPFHNPFGMWRLEPFGIA